LAGTIISPICQAAPRKERFFSKGAGGIEIKSNDSSSKLVVNQLHLNKPDFDNPRSAKELFQVQVRHSP
jgi:hypothetical protein